MGFCRVSFDLCTNAAIRGDEPPVIVELKTSFSLSLVFQGIVRQDLSDTVYLAVPPFSGRTTRRQDAPLVHGATRQGWSKGSDDAVTS